MPDWIDNAMECELPVERMWVHDGHLCAVMLHEHLFHRCGYVRVDGDSPLYGKSFDQLYDDFYSLYDVHGGVTFSDSFDDLRIKGYFIGFDCAHLGDAPDIEAGIEAYGEPPALTMEYMKATSRGLDPFGIPPHVWTLEEVCAETEKLCDLVVAVEEQAK